MTWISLLFNLVTLDKSSLMTTELGQLIFLNIALWASTRSMGLGMKRNTQGSHQTVHAGKQVLNCARWDHKGGGVLVSQHRAVNHFACLRSRMRLHK